MHAFRADRPDGVRPGRLPVEVPAAQRVRPWAGDDQRTGIGGDEDGEVLAQGRDDCAGNADDPVASSGLGRPEDDLTRGSLGDGGANGSTNTAQYSGDPAVTGPVTNPATSTREPCDRSLAW